MLNPTLFSSTPIIKPLRDYQQAATDALFKYFEEKDGAPIIVAPTGSGKTILLAEFIRRAIGMFPDTNFMVLAHVNELLIQNAQEILERCPNIKLTFCSSKLGKRDLTGQVICASIQSVHRHAYKIHHKVDLVICDECHLISDDDNSMYRKFMADMKEMNPYVKFIGYTATHFRAKTGYLHKGKNALFTDIAYNIGILDLINQGYLVPVVTPVMQTQMDVAGVKIQGGDFIQSQLERAVDVDHITNSCVAEIVQYGANRKCWIVFAAGIDHCLHIRDEIRRRGISCEMVTGKTPDTERSEIIEGHKKGSIKCVVNAQVLTTGYNNPMIDLIAFCRPTRSPVLYIQMMGRCMRTAPGKVDAIALDFGGIISALGPIDQVHVAQKKKSGGEAPVKFCPECNHECHAALRNCPACDYEFPEPELKIDKEASTAAVLSTQLKTETHKVTHVMYYRHQKEGKPDSLRVEYLCGPMQSFRTWICLEHSGKPRTNACMWWRTHADTAPPNTITDALNRKHELKIPIAIEVRKVGKYHEIVGETLC